ncbi:dNTP triphosphohydrolase [Desulfuromonas acetoxidans]|uniref:Deoxyguanosinetriphosphate triphosphohydrolase n=1 Tax=Desulfuromonas acetoxidans (strain DSM 684 / 11070) TaxID=281689 RepID=Q1JYA1_DESA6|nr:dNTP triphosphohydrolase [Desulfuromonas acetoxidans]EAT15305.1 Deoxyguanosinetriphosphate triphosphohydrolase [Desulfuromonas acetoxidans DSM 684]MBF0645586.1 dNTP triphosphohydrolase [Desulfuromonas acetoxidans]NVD23388.1 dNTP triphosphohydrolase [Desulfuromonas acetoxidans]NVE15371.1 dNTP triphosphohydrolase [Desulfuromonas acetoxidans]
MSLEWPKLLSQDRVDQPAPATPTVGERSPFEIDYDRVVFSEPFRRLAKKTQVHPLAPNDHIHNRLIHSIEVGSVGRSLGNKIQSFLVEQHPDQKALFDNIAQIIQVGCLIHDIGNPPFGHAGENTIREWVAKHDALVFNNQIDAATRNDLLLFEGNAQGFRLAARKDISQCGYMRLTYASLGAMIKYPWASDDPRAAAKKKFNVFASEKEIFTDMVARMGLQRPDGRIARHPLSFLTEAADDICYRLLDMEDAVSMRIFPEEPIKKLFLTLAGCPDDTWKPTAMARSEAIDALINETCRVFAEDYPAILNGERQTDLKSDFSDRFSGAFEEIGKLYTIIFSHRSKLGYEIGSYKMLGRIIKAFVLSAQALGERGSYHDLDFISQRCFNLAWDDAFIKTNADKPYQWWLRQIFDFVSGLTDNYAIQISGEIEGILTP